MIDLEKSMSAEDSRGFGVGGLGGGGLGGTLPMSLKSSTSSLIGDGSAYDDTRMISGSTMSAAVGTIGVLYVLAFGVVGVVALQDHVALLAVFVSVTLMLGFALLLTRSILRCHGGSLAMRGVSDPIREGAEAFFATQYTAIAKIALVVSVTLLFLYMLRPPTFGVPTLMLAVLVAISFLLGAACSAFAGFVGLWVSVRANVRVTEAATKSYNSAVQIALRGGACSGIVVVGSCTVGLAALYAAMRLLSASFELSPTQVPHLMIGKMNTVGIGLCHCC